MGLMKQSRKKKDSIVAPMSDDEGSSSAGTDSPNRPRQASRGVSFSTSRGKIWLILIANLAIVVSFIFMSSSRFPLLYGEGMVKDALEQDQSHPGPMIKNPEHGLFEDAAVTKEPQIKESGGYTKLTRTDRPKAPDEDRESETKAPLANVKEPSEGPAREENNDKDEETKPVVAVIEQSPTPTNDDTSSGFTSIPSDGEQSPVESTDQESLSKAVLPPPEPLEELEYSSTASKADLQAEDIHQSPADSTHQGSPSKAVLPPLEPSEELEYSSIASKADLQAEDIHQSVVGSEAFQDNLISLTQEPFPTEKPLIEGTQQTSTTKDTPPTQSDHGSNDSAQETPAAEVEDAAPTPKFDPRVNIFEWTPPTNADAAKATQWAKTVKDKVNYIRNFQLGGDVLRALIREHKDELIALREELFG